MGEVFYRDEAIELYVGDAAQVVAELPGGSVDCVVTSPPYWGKRDYGVAGQYGQEPTPEAFIHNLCMVFGQVRRVLADAGTVWLNLGDSYTGSWGNYVAAGSPAADRQNRSRVERFGTFRPPQSQLKGAKNLLGLPWRVVSELQDSGGWLVRNAVVWHKPNGTPESVGDRLACRYELVFLLVKQPRYFFDLDPIRAVGGRNPGDVWSVPVRPFRGAHFAVQPVEVASRCIAAGCRPGGLVLDMFSGSGTTAVAARRLSRRFIGVDLRADYHQLALERLGLPGDQGSGRES